MKMTTLIIYDMVWDVSVGIEFCRNYNTGEALISVPVSHDPITCLSINPGNWRQICVVAEKNFTVFTVEQSDTRYSTLDK